MSGSCIFVSPFVMYVNISYPALCHVLFPLLNKTLTNNTISYTKSSYFTIERHGYSLLKQLYAEFQVIRGFSQKIPVESLS